MIQELLIGSIIFLGGFYFFIEWYSNYKLKKMREAYKPEDDTSRRENYGRVETRSRPVISRESNTQGITEFEGRALFQASSNPTVTDDKREPVKPSWWNRRKKGVTEADGTEEN